jgi:hypothetical protein
MNWTAPRSASPNHFKRGEVTICFLLFGVVACEDTESTCVSQVDVAKCEAVGTMNEVMGNEVMGAEVMGTVIV